MTQKQRQLFGIWGTIIGVLGFIVLAGGALLLFRGSRSASASAHEPKAAPERPGGARVEVVRPAKGAMDRTTTQPGTVQSFQSVQLYAGVAGYLKSQTVDIGDHVKRGQELARVDVPELEKQVQRHASAVDRARAVVQQMKARVASAKADLLAANAAVVQAEAIFKSKGAELRFRQKQLERMRDLFAQRSIDERLVDEKQEQRDAAAETENAARAAIATTRAQVAAANAKIQQAESDVVEAEAEVKVAQADLEKAQVLVRFATIVSPFDGVITYRSMFPGDFVKAATEGIHTPLLTVERTDLMRIVVQIPDRDVPYANQGDPAVIELDALPGKEFHRTVARVARSEDAQTRLMRLEIDLPNPDGKICHGMYGRVTILLEKSDLMAVPSSCLAGKEKGGVGFVYVVREGIARMVQVVLGPDNGVKVGILKGLKAEDEVILQPGGTIQDGDPVNAVVVDANAKSAATH